MQNLTDNQNKAMTVLIKSCLSNMGGKTLADLREDPFVWVSCEDLVTAGWGQKEAEGTFGSLVAAGFIDEMDDDDFSLTIDWDTLASFHK